MQVNWLSCCVIRAQTHYELINLSVVRREAWRHLVVSHTHREGASSLSVAVLQERARRGLRASHMYMAIVPA